MEFLKLKKYLTGKNYFLLLIFILIFLISSVNAQNCNVKLSSANARPGETVDLIVSMDHPLVSVVGFTVNFYPDWGITINKEEIEWIIDGISPGNIQEPEYFVTYSEGIPSCYSVGLILKFDSSESWPLGLNTPILKIPVHISENANPKSYWVSFTDYCGNSGKNALSYYPGYSCEINLGDTIPGSITVIDSQYHEADLNRDNKITVEELIKYFRSVSTQPSAPSKILDVIYNWLR